MSSIVARCYAWFMIYTAHRFSPRSAPPPRSRPTSSWRHCPPRRRISGSGCHVMPSGEMTDGRCDTVAIVNGQRLIFIVANGPISRSLPIRRFNAVRGGRGYTSPLLLPNSARGTLFPFYQCFLYCKRLFSHLLHKSVAFAKPWSLPYVPQFQLMCTTLCLNKVFTFKLSVTSSIRNRFSKLLHCWKACDI